MSLLDEIKSKAASLKKTIVLCEGEDKRVVEAAEIGRASCRERV